MGASTSSLRADEIEELCSETLFKREEIINLFNRFKRLDRDNQGVINLDNLLEIPELAMNPLIHRIIDMFDLDKEDQINFKQFVQTIQPFSPNASYDEKLDFAFKVYDVDADGVISVSDVKHILSEMVGNEISEANLALIAKATVEEADSKQQGFIDLEDFSKVMDNVQLESKITINF